MDFQKADQRINIFCNPEPSLNAAILSKAVQGLCASGYAELTTITDITAAVVKLPLLVIDGDNTQAASNQLRAADIKPDFHLIVTDLGLETTGEDYSEEDLQLLKDGIVAECTITEGGVTPRFNCPCCG